MTVSSNNIAILVYTVAGTATTGCKSNAVVLLTVNSCNGIEENSSVASLNVYPNPNNGEFTIESQTAMDLVIVNEVGQVVKQLKVGGENTTKASVSGLASGIYFVSGMAQGTPIKQKIIITK
jgi:hypothetical protein